MIQEIQVINPGGVPLYYHDNSQSMRSDDVYLLQASFITALTSFANELQNGEVKIISMEKKNYLLGRSDNFILLFTSSDENVTEMLDYEPIISGACSYLDQQAQDHNLNKNSDPNRIEYDVIMNAFNSYLADQKLIQEDEDYNPSRFRKQVNSLIFRSVGYEPGKCNIGRAERLKRLTFGMTFFIISLIMLASILYFSLPKYLLFTLAIPNFFGFLGFYQYFYRFCTTNALSQNYDMN